MIAKTHECAAIDCKAQVPLRMLMCARHWRMVGKQRQMRVWLWYERLIGSPTQDSAEYDTWVQRYEAAVQSAVQRVAEQEGKTDAHQA